MASLPVPEMTEPTYLDDEVLALALALEELQPSEESDSRPNSEDPIAIEAFRAEVSERFTFLNDIKLASSIGGVFNCDEDVLAKIDRALAEKDNCKREAKFIKEHDDTIISPSG
jgi:hypothetical protein